MLKRDLPAGHEEETKRFVFNSLCWATFWLLVGTLYGLIAAVKLYWPEALELSILSFGRIRPIHTNVVMFGWSSIALVAMIASSSGQSPYFMELGFYAIFTVLTAQSLLAKLMKSMFLIGTY